MSASKLLVLTAAAAADIFITGERVWKVLDTRAAVAAVDDCAEPDEEDLRFFPCGTGFSSGEAGRLPEVAVLAAALAAFACFPELFIRMLCSNSGLSFWKFSHE